MPEDSLLTGPGSYRWWHFDLSDPDLTGWLLKVLPEIPAKALIQTETRPRCDPFEDGLILNLRGINLNEGQPADQMVSVRMWAAKDVLITVRVRRVFALAELSALAETGTAPETVIDFLEALVDRLTSRIQQEVVVISKMAEFYEANLEGDMKPAPKDLPETRRSVIKLRRYLDPQKAALDRLAGLEIPMINAADALTLRELANRTTIAVEELCALQERMVTVQEEHDLAEARRQAQHSYILSVAAAIFLPLGFLTGLFGVNIGGMPGLQSPFAFAILCVSMVLLALGLVGLMKRLGWLN